MITCRVKILKKKVSNDWKYLIVKTKHWCIVYLEICMKKFMFRHPKQIFKWKNNYLPYSGKLYTHTHTYTHCLENSFDFQMLSLCLNLPAVMHDSFGVPVNVYIQASVQNSRPKGVLRLSAFLSILNQGEGRRIA